MSLNQTPGSERLQIAFFGKRNTGKSSLVNAIAEQDVSVVSEIKGTTTDPVRKAMELAPLGPVVLLDTPGFDDTGHLGERRVARTYRILQRCDLAVLVVEPQKGVTERDRRLLFLFKEFEIPYLIVRNKKDLAGDLPPREENMLDVSAKTGEGIEELKRRLGEMVPEDLVPIPVLRDLLASNDTVVLVVPIDAGAPKGRLILPQQQTIRDILDAEAVAVVTKDETLEATLGKLKQPPTMVVTDSQVFAKVAAVVPETVPLTSFSILMARHKGFLNAAVKGAAQLDKLRDGDRILIAEGCTHHRQCGDIGREKIPRLLRRFSGRDLEFSFASGNDFPRDLSPYALILHCGGCMQPQREIAFRLRLAEEQGIPLTNYGVAIARMKGILRRSLDLFPDLQALLN